MALCPDFEVNTLFMRLLRRTLTGAGSSGGRGRRAVEPERPAEETRRGLVPRALITIPHELTAGPDRALAERSQAYLKALLPVHKLPESAQRLTKTVVLGTNDWLNLDFHAVRPGTYQLTYRGRRWRHNFGAVPSFTFSLAQGKPNFVRQFHSLPSQVFSLGRVRDALFRLFGSQSESSRARENSYGAIWTRLQEFDRQLVADLVGPPPEGLTDEVGSALARLKAGGTLEDGLEPTLEHAAFAVAAVRLAGLPLDTGFHGRPLSDWRANIVAFNEEAVRENEALRHEQEEAARRAAAAADRLARAVENAGLPLADRWRALASKSGHPVDVAGFAEMPGLALNMVSFTDAQRAHPRTAHELKRLQARLELRAANDFATPQAGELALRTGEALALELVTQSMGEALARAPADDKLRVYAEGRALLDAFADWYQGLRAQFSE